MSSCPCQPTQTPINHYLARHYLARLCLALWRDALLNKQQFCLLSVCPKPKSLELFLNLRDPFLLPTKSIVIGHDTHRLVLLHCLHLCPIFNSDNLLVLYHFQNIIGGFDIEPVLVIFRRNNGVVLEEQFNQFVRVDSRRLNWLEERRRPSTKLLDIISYSSQRPYCGVSNYFVLIEIALSNFHDQFIVVTIASEDVIIFHQP